MKKNFFAKNFSRALAVLLALTFVLSMAFTLVSCSNANGNATESSTPAPAPSESPADNKISITLEVVYPDGSSKEFPISTDPSNNLRQALEAEGLIAGEEAQYGLYVKVVDGVTADYDVDQSWWGLYKDGEMLMTGVDTTPIADGDHFEFVYSK